MVNHKEVKDFVRNVLGCGCPDEVLENINVKKDASGDGDHIGDILIDVGHRLLVLVIFRENIRGVIKNFEDIFHQGRKARDEKGYNRLRIVVATTGVTTAKKELFQIFERFRGSDDKLHLHILEECEIPGSLHV